MLSESIERIRAAIAGLPTKPVTTITVDPKTKRVKTTETVPIAGVLPVDVLAVCDAVTTPDDRTNALKLGAEGSAAHGRIVYQNVSELVHLLEKAGA